MKSITLVLLTSILATVLAAPAAEPAIEQRAYECWANDPGECNGLCAAGSAYLDCSASKCKPKPGNGFGYCTCSCKYV
ncbi:hypothetical protein TWF694_008238 [Orbilia ellipsospora]|uniref:Uncharacterized protein n=1 Tax=Orbilia ellipsospora TaxID=2528407 RepID=A0AAV9XGG8_9PEZI